MRGEGKALSYGDVLLRASDLDLLRSPTAWLNDQIMDFYFEFLTREKLQGCSSDVAFLSASVAFLVSNSAPGDLGLLLGPLDLCSKRLVLLPVNDNPDVESAGGSHWSLLAFYRDGSGFHHYDSMEGSNAAVARDLVPGMAVAVGLEPPFWVVEEKAPQQCNGYDCGLHVLAVAEALCDVEMAGGEESQREKALQHVTSDHVTGLRGKILDIVLEKIETEKNTSG